jgi:hypothetical protein
MNAAFGCSTESAAACFLSPGEQLLDDCRGVLRQMGARANESSCSGDFESLRKPPDDVLAACLPSYGVGTIWRALQPAPIEVVA